MMNMTRCGRCPLPVGDRSGGRFSGAIVLRRIGGKRSPPCRC